MFIRGVRTSEFWTHIAVLLGGGSATVGTVFDKAFVSDHPALAAAITATSLLAMTGSQIAYSISRGIAKRGADQIQG